ncbi:MAG: PH domain-containing protein [Clostridia bacterium]|nr:PH domain-containing protein [Clostridia bacterium]
MINFSQEAVFNLTGIDEDKVKKEIENLMIEDEYIVGAFKTVRDQVVFTNMRIIAIDVQGVTGKRKEFTTLPYAKIQYFAITTPGFIELIPDCELEIVFNNNFHAKFDFKSNCDIVSLGRCISEYALSV